MRFIQMLCAIAPWVPALVAAQTPPIPEWPLAPGSRVRILSPVLGDKPKTGSVVSSTSDTIFFRSAKQSNPTALGAPNIVKLEVAHGTHTRTMKGTLLGLTFGALGGAALAAATYKTPKCQTFCIDVFGRGDTAALGGVLGGAAGAIVGGIWGARPTDTWVPVTVPQR